MIRPVLAVVAVAAFSVTAAAHDTGLDRLYLDSSDPAHRCHHLRIEYWDQMIDLSRQNIRLMRYRHARPKIEDSRISEVQLKVMAAVAQGKRRMEESLDILERQARNFGCQPWPGSE